MIQRHKLELFINQIPFDTLAHKISADGILLESARQMLRTYINEMYVAYDIIEPLITRDQRILEVGAGLCLFSLFLKNEGYDITAVEPAAGGFDIFHVSKRHILEHFAPLQLKVLENNAQTLDPRKHGKFNLIFSNNVIEHIPEVESTLTALTRCLTNDGIMAHGCPNYVIPYEPHLGLIVLPFFPRLSEWLFAKRIQNRQTLWESLNFITSFDVQRWARRHSFDVRFRPELMYRAFKRLEEDKEFRKRQQHTLAGRLYFLLKYSGMLRVLRHLPAALATPMIFELRFNASLDSAPR